MTSKPLEFTGERFVPEQTREIWYEHWHRYIFALDWVKDLRVLDCACGEGYGSELLAGAGAEVIGVDADAQTIAHAKARYGARQNLNFETADCGSLPFDDGAFDAIVSFETIEHVADQQGMLAEFDRVLNGPGILILSSPDKKAYSDDTGFENPFHVRELYLDELTQMVAKYFPAYRTYGQKLLFTSAIWPLGGSATSTRFATLQSDEIRQGSVPVHAPLYFVLVGARESRYLPGDQPALHLFDDADESVYAHYNAEVKHHIDSGVEFERMNSHIKMLESKLENQQRAPWWQRLFKLNHE